MKMNDEVRGYFGKRNITDMLETNRKIFFVVPFLVLDGICIFMFVMACYSLLSDGRIQQESMKGLFVLFLPILFFTIAAIVAKNIAKKRNPIILKLEKEYGNGEEAFAELGRQFFQEDTDIFHTRAEKKQNTLWGYYFTKDWFVRFHIKSDIAKIESIACMYYGYVEQEYGGGSYSFAIVLSTGKVLNYTEGFTLEELRELEQLIHERNPDTYIVGDITDYKYMTTDSGESISLRDVTSIIQAYEERRRNHSRVW